MKNEYKIFKDYVNIYLNQRSLNSKLITIIDINDLNKVKEYNVSWYANWDEDTQSYRVEGTQYIGKVNGKLKYKRLSLSRILIDCPKNKKVDHINHNTLENRKFNLRITTDLNNLKNRKRRNSNNTSGYRNVTWMSNWWRVQLQIDGKNHLFPEKFSDVHEAGKFAEKMRKKYYGEYAGFN